LRQKETELVELARDKQQEGEQGQYENLLAIMKSGRSYTFEDFSNIELGNRNVMVTESDAAIMLEESAMKAIGDMLVRKTTKQGYNNDNNDTEQPTSKRRQHNKA
jgi:hypothetical protein